MTEKRKGILSLAAIVLFGAVLFVATNYFKFSETGEAIFRSLSADRLMFPLITIAALIDSVNPCAFSILFLTIAFLFSLGRTRKNIVSVGATYIFGVFLVYVLIGLGVLRTLQFLNIPNFVARIGGALLIFWGFLDLVNHYIPSFPLKLSIPKAAYRSIATFVEKASIPSALVLGFLVGMWEFPCTGGPYLMVLGLLHDNATFLSGFGYLLWYNFVFVFPLFIILFIAGNEILLKKAEEWKRDNVRSRLVGGIAMIVLGILIFLL